MANKEINFLELQEQEKNNLVKDFNLKPILYHQTKLQIINLLNKTLSRP